MSTPTPHNSANLGEIAKTVIMPGDPLRAKVIAEKYLLDVKKVSTVRNNLCFTGLYEGKQVTVMSSGMGCASMGIYSYELFNFYGVENIIRVGTIGALDNNYHIGDVVLAKYSITNTNYSGFYAKNGEGKVDCSQTLLTKAEEIATKTKVKVKTGYVYTTDTFYGSMQDTAHQKSTGAIGVEMECSALYLNAKQAHKKALTICTVSDELHSGKSSSSDTRQNLFLTMCKLALDLAKSL